MFCVYCSYCSSVLSANSCPKMKLFYRGCVLHDIFNSSSNWCASLPSLTAGVLRAWARSFTVGFLCFEGSHFYHWAYHENCEVILNDIFRFAGNMQRRASDNQTWGPDQWVSTWLLHNTVGWEGCVSPICWAVPPEHLVLYILDINMDTYKYMYVYGCISWEQYVCTQTFICVYPSYWWTLLVVR